ncbi:ribosomal protein S18 acetylase RimI-like enzyme [Amorphus suaedae]
MPSIRPARTSDAAALARLIDIAGEGIPSYFWTFSATGGLTPLDVGATRAARPTGGFSYRNAHVVDVDGAPVAMLLGYLQSEHDERVPVDELPPFVRPLLELEARTVGTWYLNALATLPEARGRGFAGRLLPLANRLAGRVGADTVTLVVNSVNAAAWRLYARHGFVERERRKVVAMPGRRPSDGDWVLMARRVGAAVPAA